MLFSDNIDDINDDHSSQMITDQQLMTSETTIVSTNLWLKIYVVFTVAQMLCLYLSGSGSSVKYKNTITSLIDSWIKQKIESIV